MHQIFNQLANGRRFRHRLPRKLMRRLSKVGDSLAFPDFTDSFMNSVDLQLKLILDVDGGGDGDIAAADGRDGDLRDAITGEANGCHEGRAAGHHGCRSIIWDGDQRLDNGAQ
ncbi:hypothetical protein SASPL_126965 [Salvia splendens]|uniref:Uncharacterized protein n=1 Tax=Salvia splendens TaxID=180675 RepID=A0A8X8XK07_SALSN|nr:hypothetical protein SASPL_126965 [Salvia splendens]